jgi:hypothetical protein
VDQQERASVSVAVTQAQPDAGLDLNRDFVDRGVVHMHELRG